MDKNDFNGLMDLFRVDFMSMVDKYEPLMNPARFCYLTAFMTANLASQCAPNRDMAEKLISEGVKHGLEAGFNE